jgi:hypothetical protein
MNHDQRWKPLREREKHRLQIRYNINWSNLLLICDVEVPLKIRQGLLLIDGDSCFALSHKGIRH